MSQGPRVFDQSGVELASHKESKYPPETPNHGRADRGREGRHLEGAQLPTQHFQQEDVKKNPSWWPDVNKQATRLSV